MIVRECLSKNINGHENIERFESIKIISNSIHTGIKLYLFRKF